jgi:sister chromatid cohesion protein PDS5
LFVKQLKGLADPEAAYFQQYIYLLDSLSSVKSVVLVSDVPNAETLISQLFTIFFDMAKPDGAKNIEYLMTDILVQLVDECNTIPGPVVDIIIAQFLRAGPANAQATAAKKSKHGKTDPQQQTLQAHILPPAYNMAKTICNSCVDKMSRYICQYFSEVILDSSPDRSGTPEDEDESNEPSEEDLRELQKAHVLVKELWKACPGVLQNVVPQLEQELIAENVHLRTLAVDTIGGMALTGVLANTFPLTWTQWLGRQNDKSAVVRSRWAEAAIRIIDERNDSMVVPLLEHIANKLVDGDEKVRIAVIKAIGNLDYLTITTKLSTEAPIFHENTGRSSEVKNLGKQIMERLGERARDKRPAVRTEGIHVLARIWDMAYEDIASGNELVIQQLGWIPNKILDAVYVNEPQLTLQVQLAIFETLLPLGKDIESKSKSKDEDDAVAEKKRVERFLVLVKYLEDKPKRTLFMLVGTRQAQLVKFVDQLLSTCEKWNGGVVEPEEDGSDKTAAIKQRIAQFLDFIAPLISADSLDKTKHDLWRWINNNDRRVFALMRTLINEDSSYNVIVRTIVSILDPSLSLYEDANSSCSVKSSRGLTPTPWLKPSDLSST